MKEETGYTASSVRKLGEWWVSPALVTEKMHLYLCEDLAPGPTDHQPDEELEPVVIAWDEAVRKVDAGEIRDAKSMLAILIFDRMRRPGR